MDGVITEEEIYNLYKLWCKEKGLAHNRPYRIAKNPKKTSKAIWTVMTKLAAMLEGASIDPQAYMRAGLTNINNCQPGHLISQKGIDAFEKFYNLQTVKLDSPIKEIDRSLNYVLDYCAKNKITFPDYLFHNTGKTRVAVLHLDIKTLSPYLLLVMPLYDRFISSLAEDEKHEVIHNVSKAFYVITKQKNKYLKIREALMQL